MRRKIYSFIIFIAIILGLINSSIVITGVKDGITLWYRALIPALMPYMLVGNLVIAKGYYDSFNLIGKILCKIYSIPAAASFALISGLLFGYPTCAVFAEELHRRGKLPKKCSEYLICAFNNISPGFVAGYFCIGILQNDRIAAKILLLYYFIILTCAFIIRKTIYKGKLDDVTGNEKKIPEEKDSMVIRKTVLALANVGTVVVIFSIICNFIVCFLPENITVMTVFFEITCGLRNITDAFSGKILMLISVPAICFGGMSGVIQTFLAAGKGLIDIKKYIYCKFVTIIIAVIMTYLTVYVFKIV